MRMRGRRGSVDTATGAFGAARAAACAAAAAACSEKFIRPGCDKVTGGCGQGHHLSLADREDATGSSQAATQVDVEAYGIAVTVLLTLLAAAASAAAVAARARAAQRSSPSANTVAPVGWNSRILCNRTRKPAKGRSSVVGNGNPMTRSGMQRHCSRDGHGHWQAASQGVDSPSENPAQARAEARWRCKARARKPAA